MKKFRILSALLLVGALWSAPVISYSQETDGIDTSTVEAIVNETSLSVEGLHFEFKNDKHPLTLELQETGTITLGWESLKGAQKIVAIKYSLNASDDWQVVTLSKDETELTITDLPENQIYKFYFGTGTSEANIEFDPTLFYFNTISETVFKSNQAKGKEEAAGITWGIERNLLNEIVSVYPDASFVVKYNTKIGDKQNKADKTKAPWTVNEDISIDKVSFKAKKLVGGEDYVYKIGLQLTDDLTIWSAKGKFRTERVWGIFRLLVLIGALGMFIFGMKIMSEGLQKASGSRLRNMLGSITSNRISGVITGFGITSVVQSSSVTTVMTVSFVNAGLMTLRQSAGVMMGANIGTTITAWLILLFGFKVSLSSYALIFIAFGAPLLFFTRSKLKSWASVIIGFALLFMGLGELKHAVPTLGPESAIVQFFIEYKEAWYGPVMFVFLGALVTVIIQSSSAAMALTMTMVAGGVIPFEVAAAMILGENIGTTITAELASLIGNVHAKRSARIHSLFNIIGVSWAILLFPFILKGISFFIKGDPYTDGDAANLGLALFHSSFNTINVLLLLPFVPWLVKMATKSVKSRGAADEEFKLDYIGTGLMSTPDISILEVKKELAKFGQLTARMSGFTQELLEEPNARNKTKLHAKIKKYEEITDRVEIEVANYLAKLSAGEMTEETAQRVRAMNSIANDLERIGDIFYQISKEIERKDERKIYFLPEQRNELKEMFELVDEAFATMIENITAHWDGVSIQKAIDCENAINVKRDLMRKQHLENLGDPGFNVESGMIFNNMFASLEKVGDHIINCSEAVIGEI